MRLRRHRTPPPGLQALPASELLGFLGGPALIEVPGEGPETVFVSLLLHGNEASGWEAVRRWLRGLDGAPRRSHVLLVANPMAAARGVRRLPEQPDFNRIWGGAPPADPLLAELRAAAEEIRARPLRLAIDLHNNNGPNPCHAMCMRGPGFVDARGWAGAFADRTVGVEMELGTIMEFFGRRRAAVTLECGLPGSEEGIALALEFLELVDGAAGPPPPAGAYYGMAGRLRLKPGASACFGNGAADVSFPANLAQLFNFRELAAGEAFARVNGGPAEPIELCDAKGAPRPNDLFARRGDELVVARGFMPAMLVADAGIVRQDCLGYVLEPWDAAR